MSIVAEPMRVSPFGDIAPHHRHRHLWTVVTLLEVVAASVAVVFDLLVPTILLLALAGMSLMVRRERFASLGFDRVPAPGHLVITMLGLAALWSLLQIAVFMPITNHLSGSEVDLGDYDDLRGNVGLLIVLLVLSWTLAAIGEETAYRGYVQTRMGQLFGSDRLAVVIAIALTSVMFGRAHSEQGLVGMVTIALDGVLFSVVRYRFKTLWASVLAHGFNNTIGLVAFFLIGPIHGLW